MSNIINFKEVQQKAQKGEGYAEGECEHIDVFMELINSEGDGYDGWDLAMLCNKFTVLHVIGVQYETGDDARVAFVIISEPDFDNNKPGLIGFFVEQAGLFQTSWSHRWWCDEFIEYTDPNLTHKNEITGYFIESRLDQGLNCIVYSDCELEVKS